MSFLAKCWEVTKKGFQVLTGGFKSVHMAVTLFNVGSILVTGINDLIAKKQNSEDPTSCKTYDPSTLLLVGFGSAVAVTSALLVVTKFKQTNFKNPSETKKTASANSSTSEVSTTTLNSPLALDNDENENTEIIPVVENNYGSVSALELEKPLSWKGRFFSVGNTMFTLVDAALNAWPYLSFTPISYVNIPLSAVCFLGLLNQNIRFTRELEGAAAWKFHESTPNKAIDLMGTAARVGAAKISLWRLIDKQGFSSGLSVFLKTLGVIEPSIFLSKWSNYQSKLPNEKNDQTVMEIFKGLWIDIAYAIQDGALYAFSGTQSPIFNKEVYRCKEEIPIILAGIYATAEAIAYGPKYLELARTTLIPDNDEQEVKSSILEIAGQVRF